MRKITMVLFLLAAIISYAGSFDISGKFNLTYDEFTEKDGNQWYSMNGTGNIFGTDEYFQSTTDNPDDNREKFEGELILDLNASVENITMHVGLEGVVDEFLGRINGVETTYGQEHGTVRDNNPLIVTDLTLIADTKFGKVTATNSFNFHFNDRVLTTQFDDNDGEAVPYGEGILVEKTIKGVAARGFLFQSTEPDEDSYPGEYYGSEGDTKSDTPLFTDGSVSDPDKLIYGIEAKKEFEYGEGSILVINEHDKATDEAGENFDKEKDILRVALNGEYSPSYMVTLKGEIITAQYGDDVDELSIFKAYPWGVTGVENVTDDMLEDSEVYEVGATFTPLPDLKITSTYKDVGEDYLGVLGATHRKNSWMGDSNFNYIEDNGYERGTEVNIEYVVPTMLDPRISVDFTNYEKTRSQLDDIEDDVENELEVGLALGEGKWRAGGAYRYKTITNGYDDNADDNREKDLEVHDYGIDGSYQLYTTDKINVKTIGELNFYTGDDHLAEDGKQNFSNETRFKLATVASYKYTDVVTFTGEYRFGHATEDNDIIEDASGTQNLIKVGMDYKINNSATLSLMYKFDTYKLDRELEKGYEDLANSEYKKDLDHQWYDGLESWEHTGPDTWKYPIAVDYEGYTTHEVKAVLSVSF